MVIDDIQIQRDSDLLEDHELGFYPIHSKICIRCLDNNIVILNNYEKIHINEGKHDHYIFGMVSGKCDNCGRVNYNQVSRKECDCDRK